MRAKKKNVGDTFEGIGEMLGMPRSRPLDLTPPMRLAIGRIGYPGEGLRLTVSLGRPYTFNAEIKLSRADTTWLIQRLQAELADPKNDNLPKGTR